VLFLVKGILFEVLTIDDRAEVEGVLRFDFFEFSTVFILTIPCSLYRFLKVRRTNIHSIYMGMYYGCQ